MKIIDMSEESVLLRAMDKYDPLVYALIIICFCFMGLTGCQTLKSYSDYKQKHDAKCECAWTCPPAWGAPMGDGK